MRVENRKARFDYEVIKTYEAGIMLTGAEVKSIREGRVSLAGSHVTVRDNEVWIIGMNISRYSHDGREDQAVDRERKLLLKRGEIDEIGVERRASSLTMVPLALYNKGALIKLEVGLVRGRKRPQKKELVRRREQEREIQRRLKIK